MRGHLRGDGKSDRFEETQSSRPRQRPGTLADPANARRSARGKRRLNQPIDVENVCAEDEGGDATSHRGSRLTPGSTKGRTAGGIGSAPGSGPGIANLPSTFRVPGNLPRNISIPDKQELRERHIVQKKTARSKLPRSWKGFGDEPPSRQRTKIKRQRRKKLSGHKNGRKQQNTTAASGTSPSPSLRTS